MTFQEVIQRLANNLLNYFAEIYHSAEAVTIDNIRKPMVTLANEWVDLSPTDESEIIYIRRAGDDEVQESLKISSCEPSYKMRSLVRIVYFRDHAEDHARVIANLLQSSLTTGTRLSKIITDKWKLQKEESSGAYEFGPKTAYFALDLYVLWELMGNDCEQDYCVSLPNPMCAVESGV